MTPSVKIDGFIEVFGRDLTELGSPGAALIGIGGIERIEFSGHAGDGSPRTLRLICAARAPKGPAAYAALASSHLLWTPGTLVKDGNGNYSVPPGAMAVVKVGLHLPSPLSPEGRGYWMTFKGVKGDGQWQFDLAKSDDYGGKCYSTDGQGHWNATLIGDLIGLAYGRQAIETFIQYWALRSTEVWGRQTRGTRHFLFNDSDPLLLKSRHAPMFGLRLETDADATKGVVHEAVAHYLAGARYEVPPDTSASDQNQDTDEIRELNLSALTGLADGGSQPYNLLLRGGADMLCVIDQGSADPGRDSFVLEWRDVAGDHLTHGHICLRNLWALLARHYALGLAATKARNRLTFFPDDICFDRNGALPLGGLWRVRFRVLRTEGANGTNWSLRLDELLPDSKDKPRDAMLVFSGVSDRYTAPLRRAAQLTAPGWLSLIAAGKVDAPERPLLRLAAGEQVGPAKSDLVVGGALLQVTEILQLELQVSHRSPLFNYSQAPLEAEVRMDLGGVMLRPASQDPEAGFETLSAWQQRERPLSINLSTPGLGVVYQCFETASKDQSRIMRISVLAERDGLLGDTDIVVLDPAPLLVARVYMRGAQQVEKGALLAEYTEDAELASEWSFTNPTGAMTLILPPQSIGEEAIKDIASYPGTSDPLPRVGELFDFRLSPSARLDVDLSDIDTARTTAPWATRRLFSQRQGVVGVKTLKARFELLYGLTTNVDATGLRIAETDAFVGRVPFSDDLLRLYRDSRVTGGGKAHAAARTAQSAYANRMAGWINGLFRRPSQLTMFRDFTDRTQLTLSEGVSFHPRPTRQTANPFQLDQFASPDAPADGRDPLRGGLDFAFESPAVANMFWGDAKPGTGGVTGLRLGTLGGTGAQQAAFNNGKTLIITDTTDGRLNSLTLIRLGRIGMLWNRARHVIVYERTTRTAPRYRKRPRKEADQPVAFEGVAAMRKVKEYVEITQPRRQYPDSQTADPINGPLLAAAFDTIAIPVKSSWGMDVEQGWCVALRGPLAAEEERFYPFPKIYAELARSESKGGGHVNQQLADPSQLYFFTSTNPADGGDTDTWPAWPGIDYPVLGRPNAPRASADSRFNNTRMGNARQPDASHHDLGQRRFTVDLVPTEEAVNLMHGRPFDGTDARVANISLARGMPPLATLLPADHTDAATAATGFGSMQAYVDEGLAELGAHLRQLAANAPDAPLPPDTRKAALALVEQLKAGIQAGKKDVEKLAAIHHAEDWIARQAKLGAQAAAGDDYYLGNGNDIGIWQRQLEAAVASIANIDLAHVDQARQRILDTLASVRSQLEERIQAEPSVVSRALDSIERLASEAEARAQGWLSGEQTRLASLVDRLAAADDGSQQQIDAARRAIVEALDGIGLTAGVFAAHATSWLQAGLAEWFAPAPGITVPGSDEFGEGLEQLQLEAEVWGAECALALGDGAPDWDALRAMVTSFAWSETLYGAARGWLLDRQDEALDGLQTLRDGAIAALAERATKIEDALHAMTSLPDLKNSGAKLLELLDDSTGGARNLLNGLRGELKKHVNDLSQAGGVWNDVIQAKQDLNQHRAVVEQQLQQVFDSINGNVAAGAAALLGALESHLAPLQRSLQTMSGEVESAVAGALSGWREESERLQQHALEFTRALATGPLTDTLQATRDQLGYYYDAGRAALDVTKSSALFNQAAGDALNALSAAMPFDRLRDRLLPQLADFQVNKLLPDFGGLKLDYLLKDLKIPDDPLAEYGWIKMSHGYDKDQLRAWADVNIDKTFPGSNELFALSPFTLSSISPQFKAYSRMEIGRDGVKSQTTSATLSADWELALNGKSVLTIRKGVLHYDSSGGFKFDMDINAVVLDDSLRFLTDALQLMKPNDSGVMITPILPGGVSATMDLPLPDIGTGAFTLTGLALSMHFDLLFAPRFEIRTGIWLSKPERPFGLAVLFLGGGGWFGVDLSYQPPGNFVTRVSIGISAGAFAALNFGVATGSAGLLFTVGLDFYNASGARKGSSTAISVGLLMWGEFSICGVASAYVRVVMRVTQMNGEMTGYGMIEVCIKICWCFTLRVSSPIAMPFKGGSADRAALAAAALVAPPTVAEALDAHFANLDL